MEQYFQDNNATIMTIDQLRQIYPNFQINEEQGNESVFLLNPNGMEYQPQEGQVIIDSSTGQPIQLGTYQQVNTQCHQPRIIAVLQQELTESSGPSTENMETQTMPMSSHQMVYHQQQNQLGQIAQQELQQQIQLEQQQQQQQSQQILHDQMQQHIAQERLKQQQQLDQQQSQMQQVQQQQLQQQLHPEQQMQQQLHPTHQVHQLQRFHPEPQIQQQLQTQEQTTIEQLQQNFQQQIQQHLREEERRKQEVQKVQQQNARLLEEEKLNIKIQQQLQEQQKIQQQLQEQQKLQQQLQEQQKLQQMQQQQQKVANLQLQRLQQEQIIQRQFYKESNGFVTTDQETVQMRLESQQVNSMQVESGQQVCNATFVPAGTQLLIPTANVLSLPGGRKIPLRDWRKTTAVMSQPTNQVSTIQSTANHVATLQLPIPSNHISTIQSTTNHVSIIQSPANPMASNHISDCNVITPMKPGIIHRPIHRPSFSYRTTNPVTRLPTVLQTSPVFVSDQSVAMMSGIQRRPSLTPKRAAPQRRGSVRGRVRCSGNNMTEEQLEMQANATAQYILNTHRQSELAKQGSLQRAQQRPQQRMQQQQIQRSVIRHHPSLVHKPPDQQQQVVQQCQRMQGAPSPVKPPQEKTEDVSTNIMIILPNGHSLTVDNPYGLSIPQVLKQIGFPTDNFQVVEPHDLQTPLGRTIQEEYTPPQPAVPEPTDDQYCQTQVAQPEPCQPEPNPVDHCLPPPITEESSQEPAVNGKNVSEAGNVTNLQETVITSSSKVTTLTPNSALEGLSEEQKAIGTSAPDPVIDPTPVKKEYAPRLVPGMLALCPSCGYSSIDFNQCQRCKRHLPADCKRVSANADRRKPAQLVKEEAQAEVVSPTQSAAPARSPAPTKTLPPVFVEVPALRGRRPRPLVRRTKPKQPEEPVLLTLSSDDEATEADAAPAPLLFSTPGVLNISTSAGISVRKKEPSIKESEGVCGGPLCGGGYDSELEKMMHGTDGGTFVILDCRTVRIGSYKVVPMDKVIINAKGIKLVIPHLEDPSSRVTIVLPIVEITKVLMHFGKAMPVLFVYAKSCTSVRVCSQLKMTAKNGHDYSPTGPEIGRRITILPFRIPEETKVILKSILPQGILSELTHAEANDILIRASPTEVRKSGGPLLKTNQGFSGVKLEGNGMKGVRQIMVYPPPPETGGISINTEDYSCLGAMQFLNDVIIDFYLKYLMLSVLSAADRKRTHIFSTFFYNRLTTRAKKNKKSTIEEDPKLSAAEKRHVRVKSWTKKVNIFEKDFIIIPINEHSHWFLAIICFPGLTGPVRISDETPVAAEVAAPVPRRPAGRVIQPTVKLEPGEIQQPSIQLEMTAEGSDRDEADEEEEDLEQSDDEEVAAGESSEVPASQESSPPSSAEEAAQKAATSPPKARSRNRHPQDAIKQPCILIFDSLSGTMRTRIVATLRDYLRIEYKAKMKVDREFNKDTIKGASPKVPQQNNFYDCGLYVLQYVESFFQTPVRDYRLPMKELAEWFDDDIVSRKREEIVDLLKRLMTENNLDTSELPRLSFLVTDSGSEETPDGETVVHTTETVYTEETNVNDFIPESEDFSSVTTVEVPCLDNHTSRDEDDEEEEDDEIEDQLLFTKFPNLKRLVPDQDILNTKAKRIRSRIGE